jgi:hypothetical protein
MPWGKYKGRHLAEVPCGYIAWVLESCGNVGGEFRRALEREPIDRLGIDVRPSGPFRAPAPKPKKKPRRPQAIDFFPDS